MKFFYFTFVFFFLFLVGYSQQANFVSTTFYNSTTCEVTIQVGLERKNANCSNNTIGIVSVDFTIQWSIDLQLVSAGFIPSGQKLDDTFYFSDLGADNGLPLNEYGPTNSGNATGSKTTANAGAYKTYRILRSTNKCDNIILLNCGMIVPFFVAKFKIDCAKANEYSFTYNHANGADNSNYIAEFITNPLANPSNPKKEILLYTNNTQSFTDVAGQCKPGQEINNSNTLSTNTSENNFVNTYGAVLPVVLDYFKAVQKQPYAISIEWASLTEINNAEYVLERSNDQTKWIVIGSVKPSGNSNSRKVYQYIDRQPLSGVSFYRLKSIDIEGKINYSSMVRIHNSFNKELSIFPNPVTTIATIFKKASFKANQLVQIIDSKGTRLKTIVPLGGNYLQVDLSKYASGLYLIQLLESGRIVENLQLIKH